MKDIESALRSLPDSIDLEPRPDLIASVRRTHRHRSLRRRSAVAGVALATLGIVTVPTMLRNDDGGTVNPGASQGAQGAVDGTVTKQSLDAALAALATSPGAGEPRPTGTFAYTHSRTRYLAMTGAGGGNDASQPSPSDVPTENAEKSPSAGAETLLPDQQQVSFTYLYGTERHIWLDKLSGGHLVSKPLAPKFLNPGDDAIYRKAIGEEHGMDLALDNGGQPVNVPNLSFDASALPSDPAAMRQYLQDVPSGVDDVNERVFTAAADLVREHILPHKVRSTILRALLLVPDVSVVEGVADLDGRAGIGIGRIERGTTLRQLILDAEGTVLGERDSVAVAGEFGPVGTVIGHTAVLEAGFVDKVGDTPSGRPIAISSQGAGKEMR
ncbi:MAG: hypothetical protein ABIM89_06880 [Mycobacteriales bacterium]